MSKLATWKIENHIEFSVCEQLLKILNPYHPELPLSTRTLVKTPRKAVILQTIPPGKYYRFGIEKGILDTLLFLDVEEFPVNPVPLKVGIDSVHLINSSGSHFWRRKDSPPFPIGVFHAFSNPTSSNAFLLDLIAEAEALYEIGFLFKEKCYLVKIESFICDAPAKAMILCMLCQMRSIWSVCWWIAHKCFL